jgi:hypothetical protein
MADTQVALLLELIDQAFDRRSWHGTNLRGAIRSVTAEQASWRPAPGRHNVWELVVHAAYWKYTVRRRFRDEARGSFPLKGSNWFERPADGFDTEAVWREDVALLVDTHRTMREAVARLRDRDLDVVAPGTKTNNRAILAGIAAHDLYHAGQIQLLKRLRDGAAESEV